ncbi:spore maturation protein [Natranaerobius thermophilus]|uniref:Nucleoside recognition domain protein n=1 Tax=Natranaerobius thermophilus (strain ATCC BAA-1301 / DSM 18059 / JW/NM-WN-LF) TaxID=457570 RepID=B2A4P5_NATTJ|nr:spore maturation protein [Natranaerobius thermophilus]ACB85220.1 nucleoside recognition domain protein [Natranaerobius thermophilus JW/NM-WN-LF]
MFEVVNFISKWAVPAMITITLLYGYFKKINVFDVFIEGAKEGFETSVKLIPSLVAMLSALGIFRASGGMDFILEIIEPVMDTFNIPTEVVPLALMRPISGSSTFAMTTELIHSHGPDSLVGRIASTMQGSTDTTLFVLTVYFGAVGIKKTRHAMGVGLVGDFVGFIVSVFICLAVFT